MSDALTRDERRIWKQGTEDIATDPKGFVSIEVLAMNRRRYEATLREQDERITALVEACKKALKRLIQKTSECECHQYADGEYYYCAQCQIRAAIKEATS